MRAWLVGAVLASGVAFDAAAQCRQALALGIDVSGSIDSAEYDLQMHGLANALVDPGVVDSFLILPDAPVSLVIYDWSGASQQRVIVPWTSVRSYGDLADIADILRATPRDERDPGTALGIAMQLGLDLLAQQTECWHHTLDVSGDGKNNAGIAPRTVKSNAGHVTINGLVIGQDVPPRLSKQELHVGELTSYYHLHVKHGPGAFLEIALGFEDFERAMRQKLLRELALPTLSLLDQ
ncbi:MAG: DUF1194 domain-containing protein [Pseudomonadota bacterium]